MRKQGTIISGTCPNLLFQRSATLANGAGSTNHCGGLARNAQFGISKPPDPCQPLAKHVTNHSKQMFNAVYNMPKSCALGSWVCLPTVDTGQAKEVVKRFWWPEQIASSNPTWPRSSGSNSPTVAIMVRQVSKGRQPPTTDAKKKKKKKHTHTNAITFKIVGRWPCVSWKPCTNGVNCQRRLQSQR
jgi:hypothetical protein